MTVATISIWMSTSMWGPMSSVEMFLGDNNSYNHIILPCTT